MTIRILSLAIVLLSFSYPAINQAIPKTDLLMLANGVYGGGVEYFFNSRFSAQTEIYYASSSVSYLERSEAWMALTQARFYPIGENRPRGLFAAPAVIYLHGRNTDAADKESVFGFGLLAGIQSQLGTRLTIDASLGPLYVIHKKSYERYSPDKEFGWTGILKFSVGFSLFPVNE